jgi:peptidoglycan-associated lipoprotein
MKFFQSIKLTLLFVTLFGLAACSSTSEEADSEGATTETASVDVGARNSQEEEAAAHAAAAKERAARAALNTTVFYFDFDVSEFRAADREVLTHHARSLATNPSKHIRLEGHADERGTRAYNLALGERRAEGILNYLIVNGASRSQIEVISYGEERPADRSTSESAYQQNRRVEIVIP